MAHSSTNYQREYMRAYRAKQQKARETAKDLSNYVTNTVINNEIWALIREKYQMTDYEACSIASGLTDFIKVECPNNTPEEISSILNAHLLCYYRNGFIQTILIAYRHPSLSLCFPFDSHITEWLKEKEGE